MANHLNAKSSQNRTSSNAGYLMIKSSRKIAFHTAIKVTKGKRLHSGKTINGEKENRLISFSIRFSGKRVILQLFKTSTSTGPYVYDM